MSLVSCFTMSMVLPAILAADGPAPAKGPGRSQPRAAHSGGVAIEFSPRKLLDAEKTPEGELKAILGGTAVLKTERPIRYRSTVLPAGSYPVTITAGDERAGGRSLFFLVGPAGESAQARGDAAPEERKSVEENGGKQAARETAGPPGPTAEGEKAGGARTPQKPLPGQIKAIFHLSPAARPSEMVEFSVRPTARGDRFALAVRSGGSQGKATLRFAD